MHVLHDKNRRNCHQLPWSRLGVWVKAGFRLNPLLLSPWVWIIRSVVIERAEPRCSLSSGSQVTCQIRRPVTLTTLSATSRANISVLTPRCQMHHQPRDKLRPISQPGASFNLWHLCLAALTQHGLFSAFVLFTSPTLLFYFLDKAIETHGWEKPKPVASCSRFLWSSWGAFWCRFWMLTQSRKQYRTWKQPYLQNRIIIKMQNGHNLLI